MVRLRWVPARAAICRPTGTEPVKDTTRTRGDSINWREMSAGTPHTRLSAPAGRPASWNSRASATMALGDSSGPLSTTVQPAPSAAASFFAAWPKGKFQGLNAATTPAGSRTTHCRTDGWRGGTTRP